MLAFTHRSVLFLLFLLPLFLFSAALFAKDCSQDDILFYLKHGFNHDQVVRLCSTIPHPASPVHVTAPSTSFSTKKSAVISNTQSVGERGSSVSDKDQLYFETVLDAQKVSLTPERLTLDRKECAVYGELDMTETRDKVCINTQISLSFNNLNIVKAVKGIPLLRKQELLVKGNIKRAYPDLSQMQIYKINAIREQLPDSPQQYNIPVKSGIDPGAVAKRLSSYIK